MMTQWLYALFADNERLPKGTRIMCTDGVVRKLTDDQLAAANKLPNLFSNYVPFWILGWCDLHENLLPPEEQE